LLRASLLQCLFSIRSERALVEHIDFNMLYQPMVRYRQLDPFVPNPMQRAAY